MRRLCALLAAGLLLAACSSAKPAPDRTNDSASPSTSAPTRPTPTVVPTTALDTGAITHKDGGCPLVSVSAAVANGGMRLIRTVVFTQGGRVVGCDFYADPNFAASEHLPGPNQPAVSVRVARYANATIAFNAMARTGSAGGAAHEVNLSTKVKGVAFRTRFDPSDGKTDWAYVYNVGTKVVTVLTAQSANELAGIDIGKAILPHVS
ncbi:MAG: hypothetical protein ACR2KJ_16860 [Jatrophihabitans sp.]